MPKSRIIGIILLIVGVGIAFGGYQISSSVGSQLSRAVSGSFTNKVMIYYISGAAFIAAGIYAMSKK